MLTGFAAVVTVLAIAERDHANEARNQAAIARREADKAETSDRRNRQLLLLSAQAYLEQGRQLLVGGQFQESVPYLIAARRNGEDGVALRMMFREAARHLPTIPALEHDDGVVDAVFNASGTRVLTTTSRTARAWDATTGRPLSDPIEHDGSLRPAFSPDGTRVLTASDDNTARVWDAASGQLVTSSAMHRSGVTSATFSPDGARMLIVSGHTARVWDAATGRPFSKLLLPLEHAARASVAVFTRDGTRVVTLSGNAAWVWDVRLDDGSLEQ